MAKKIILRHKSKHCAKCHRQFIGSIDSSGLFCSDICKSEFKIQIVTKNENLVTHDAKVNPIRKKKPKVSYPFRCKNCTVLVEKKIFTKAHRKGLCFKSCTAGNGKKIAEQNKPEDHVAPKFQKQSIARIKVYGNSFYTQPQWLQLRYQALITYGRICHACRTTDVVVQVDHIKPRSKYPELAFDINNLQVLCEPCNLGKGAWDETDWRDS
jgi:hypothetical protein